MLHCALCSRHVYCFGHLRREEDALTMMASTRSADFRNFGPHSRSMIVVVTEGLRQSRSAWRFTRNPQICRSR
jgi:hypothetical protein